MFAYILQIIALIKNTIFINTSLFQEQLFMLFKCLVMYTCKYKVVSIITFTLIIKCVSMKLPTVFYRKKRVYLFYRLNCFYRHLFWTLSIYL